jgi:hypothetical protein
VQTAARNTSSSDTRQPVPAESSAQ